MKEERYTKRLKEIKDWYNKEYKKRGHNFGVELDAYIQPARILWENNLIWHNDYYLDIACGQGYMLSWAEYYGIKNLYGTDISKEAIKLSEQLVPNAKYSLCQAEYLNFPNRVFKYITCIGSLEHFIDIDKSLQEMYRVLTNDGKLCILVPNGSSWFNNHTEQEEINENILSKKEWERKFKKAGFFIEKIYRDEYHLWIKKQSRIKQIINGLTPKCKFHSLFYLLSKEYSKYEL